MTDLLYSEAETDLRAAVRALLADRADPAALPARLEGTGPHDAELWHALAGGIGAAGLLVPEKLGGQGATHREAAVVLEELGRAVAPLPYLTSSVVATQTLLALGPSDEAAELLADLASGRRTAVLAVPLTTAPDAPLPTEPPTAPTDTPATAPGVTVTAVADAVLADVLLVPRPDGLHAVDAAEAALRPLTPLDLTRPLAAVTVPANAPGTRLADAGTSRAAVRSGLVAGAGLLASEQLGLAEWCLEEAVRHTRARHQFNRPIGSFQALKHRMAELWLEVAGARAAARNAADALATGSPDAPLAVAVAQAYCSRVAVHAAEECVQLHGGIGMTWEHPAHLYLKRAKADQLAYGAAGHHQDTIAGLVDLPAPAP
ncbi:acyl-CoA dehydrogenase family protein [Streptomyces thermolilacinus]|uniref:Acyl-CoA dehydrogenase n=1 Tax=Streptomyces thermolilacinus SPC6 TaxID=1306406 RepID=A0A1D3DLW3_9ACTN|nr:acyl-CoA dehydrogenase family protein [Streptomyces thermolilacinus]OEJ93312.1 acyl-CoA dehydrogenase [Streptomyces thermolilacinus SPC6]